MMHSVQPPTDDELRTVPIFPLPDLVLFPGTPVPLHFFEPRYRAMIEHCMSHGPRLLALTRFEPGWEPDYERAPAIRTLGSLGRIVAHRRRPEGTHDAVLFGLARARIHELPMSPRGFRLARIELLPDEGAPEQASDVTVLHSCANAIATRIRRDQPDFALGLRGDENPRELADVLADRLVADADVRQQILECRDPSRRIKLVLDEAGKLLLRMRDDVDECTPS